MRELRLSTGFAGLVLYSLALTACGGETASGLDEEARDPVLARALNDPLMVDPDLAYRNEAAAALTISWDNALPVLAGNAELARLARDSARLELLEDGPIVDLPDAGDDAEGVQLSGLRSAAEMAKAHGVDDDCADQLRAGFKWAAQLDDAAAIMPHGHVRAAAGVENAKCSLRVVSYLTPAEAEDVLEYHFNRAGRADMKPRVFTQPEASLSANSENASFAANVRPAAHAMRAVELIYWRKK